MPSFADWLRASWTEFRSRWGVLIVVLGAGGAGTLLGGFFPIVLAVIVSLFGVFSAWAVWGMAAAVAILAILWLSTWAQAALVRAAMTDESAMGCMTRAWSQTDAFAWALTLAILAVAGGWVLFVIPGLIISVNLFAAPMIVISEETHGVRALAVSWGRTAPRFFAVASRIAALGLITVLPGRIPYVGWIVAMFWAPFGVVAAARLAKDLRAADPTPTEPGWMTGAVAGLTAVFVLGSAAAGVAAWHVARNALDNFGGLEGVASRVRPESTQALFDAIGRGDEDAQKKTLDAIVAQILTSSATATGARP